MGPQESKSVQNVNGHIRDNYTIIWPYLHIIYRRKVLFADKDVERNVGIRFNDK
jgi:hypothetical protein